MLKDNSRAIKLQSPLIIKDFCRNCSGWRGRKGEAPALHSRRSGEVLSCVRLSEDCCSSGLQPFVAVGMVKVPMRVDQVLDGVGAD